MVDADLLKCSVYSLQCRKLFVFVSLCMCVYARAFWAGRNSPWLCSHTFEFYYCLVKKKKTCKHLIVNEPLSTEIQ